MSYIEVKVQTRASKRSIEQLNDGHFKAWVTAPPFKGKANQEVLALLAEFFNLPLSRVKLIRGHRSKIKLIKIEKT